MEIKKLLTPFNHNSGNASRIKYIVIHYVGATGGAEANCKWYAGGDRGASAHYFIDFDGGIWQSIEDKDIAWHCGAKTYKHAECRNANSIGIELCVRNKGNKNPDSQDWYFENATVTAAIRLTRFLMDKYGVGEGQVVRHYDVTGKLCPNPYVYNTGGHTWSEFKAGLNDVTKKSGWNQEGNNWYYYNGNTGIKVCNDWVNDTENNKWYWFDGSGKMVTDTWYQYKGEWYYLGSDGAMVKGIQAAGGKWYYLGSDGAMVMDPVKLTPDQNGALKYPEILKK